MASGLVLVLTAISSTALAVAVAVPEIDPGSLSTVVALVIGGTMLFKHGKK